MNVIAERKPRVELIDNRHEHWPEALSLVDSLGQRDSLMLGEGDWLSARQNLLVAFVDDEAAGFLCFHVEPVGDTHGDTHVEARFDAKGVARRFARAEIEHELEQAALFRAASITRPN
jgi:hypothetical protein